MQPPTTLILTNRSNTIPPKNKMYRGASYVRAAGKYFIQDNQSKCCLICHKKHQKRTMVVVCQKCNKWSLSCKEDEDFVCHSCKGNEINKNLIKEMISDDGSKRHNEIMHRHDESNNQNITTPNSTPSDFKYSFHNASTSSNGTSRGDSSRTANNQNTTTQNSTPLDFKSSFHNASTSFNGTWRGDSSRIDVCKSDDCNEVEDFAAGQDVYFYVSSRDTYKSANITKVESVDNVMLVTFEYKEDDQSISRTVIPDCLEQNILVRKRDKNIVESHFDTKNARIKKLKNKEKIIYFQASSGTYVSGVVDKIEDVDIDLCDEHYATMKVELKVRRECDKEDKKTVQHKAAGGQHKAARGKCKAAKGKRKATAKGTLSIIPLENRWFVPSDNFDPNYKPTYQKKVLDTSNEKIQKSMIGLISQFFKSKLITERNVVTIASADVGSSLMSNDSHDIESLLKEEQIELNYTIIIIPIVSAKQKGVLIRYSFERDEKSNSTTEKEQVKQVDRYCIKFYYINCSNNNESIQNHLVEKYGETKLFTYNVSHSAEWQDITFEQCMMEQYGSCVYNTLYALMKHLLGPINFTVKEYIEDNVDEAEF